MTRSEKEARIVSRTGEFPSWMELMELAQFTKRGRLETAEDDLERQNIERDYDSELDKIIAAAG